MWKGTECPLVDECHNYGYMKIIFLISVNVHYISLWNDYGVYLNSNV